MKKFFVQTMKRQVRGKTIISLEQQLTPLLNLSKLVKSAKIDQKVFEPIKEPLFNKALEKIKQIESGGKLSELIKYCNNFIKDVDQLELSERESKIVSKIYTSLAKALCRGTHNDAMNAKTYFEKAILLDQDNQLARDEKEHLSAEMGETSSHHILHQKEEDEDISKFTKK